MLGSNNALGYIMIDGTDSQLRGAVIVTDFRGIPLDFKYTEPLKLNRLQRIIYGKSLNTYLKEHLLLESLLEAVEISPQLWLCSDEELLNPLKENGNLKVLLLQNTNREPLESIGHVEAEGAYYVLQAEKSGSPLRIKFPEKVRPDEVKASVNILIEASKSMDLMDAFTRLQKAISSINSGVE